MLFETDDLRIASLHPLIPPAILMEELPLGDSAASTVVEGRRQVESVLRGEDDRLLVIAGPCSIHDPKAALEYASRLKEISTSKMKDLLIVMRVYFEKPRTTIGWKGLINDPHLDDSFAINEGLRVARGLLLELADKGIPTGCEFLDPITPQFFADLVSWGAIGARTSESQVHRELASGMSMPVGFKNGTNGNLQVAIDAIGSAAHPHRFLSVTKHGVAAIVATQGNRDCHLILRGGSSGPNFDQKSLLSASDALSKAGASTRLIVDCSHANSGKDHKVQPQVAASVAAQVASGSTNIAGVMLESFLEDGNQKTSTLENLTYGQSITDKCMGWDRTMPVLEQLADSARKRRESS